MPRRKSRAFTAIKLESMQVIRHGGDGTPEDLSLIHI